MLRPALLPDMSKISLVVSHDMRELVGEQPERLMEGAANKVGRNSQLERCVARAK